MLSLTHLARFPCPGKCYQLNYKQFSPKMERARIFLPISGAIPSPRVFKPCTGSGGQVLAVARAATWKGDRVPEPHALQCNIQGTWQRCRPPPGLTTVGILWG